MKPVGGRQRRLGGGRTFTTTTSAVSWILMLFGLLMALAFLGKTALVEVEARVGEHQDDLSTATTSSKQHLWHQHVRRSLQSLVSFGGNPSPEHLPLPVCAGDCNTDDDVCTTDHSVLLMFCGSCFFLLIMFDFCFWKYETESMFMLPSQQKCAEGLVCWQRDAGDPVPFCEPRKNDEDDALADAVVSKTMVAPKAKTDYCIPETVAVEALAGLLNNNNNNAATTTSTTTEDNDVENEDDFAGLDSEGAGMDDDTIDGEDDDVAAVDDDFDGEDDAEEEKALQFSTVSPTPSPAIMLERTEPPTFLDEIPTAVAQDANEHYELLAEMDPPTRTPTEESNKDTSPVPAPSVAAGGIFEFRGPPVSLAPTDESWALFLENDYSTDPVPLIYVGNDEEFDAPYPLGPCQSDCDTDDDCMGPLVCFQRKEGVGIPHNYISVNLVGVEFGFLTTGDLCFNFFQMNRENPCLDAWEKTQEETITVFSQSILRQRKKTHKTKQRHGAKGFN